MLDRSYGAYFDIYNWVDSIQQEAKMTQSKISEVIEKINNLCNKIGLARGLKGGKTLNEYADKQLHDAVGIGVEIVNLLSVVEQEQACSVCKGTGETIQDLGNLPPDYAPCPACDGTGSKIRQLEKQVAEWDKLIKKLADALWLIKTTRDRYEKEGIRFNPTMLNEKLEESLARITEWRKKK
jgi:peptidoglycan hydrolase CwlO-like protein